MLAPELINHKKTRIADDSEMIVIEAELLLQNHSKFDIKEADLLHFLENPKYKPGKEAVGDQAADEYEDYGEYDDEFA